MDGLTVLVLAAGAGSRLAPAVGPRPKPLVEIAGAPVLVHNLRWLAAAGVRHVWINLHYGAALIREAIGDGSALGLEVSYLFEPALLGTAGATRNLDGAWRDQLLVVYGDNFARFSVTDLLAFHRHHPDPVSIAVFDPRRCANTGIAGGRITLGRGSRVKSFTEGTPAAGGGMVNAGVYVLDAFIRAATAGDGPLDFGRDVFPALLAAGVPMRGYEIDGFCLGLDTPASYGRALEMVDRGEVVLA